MHWKMLKLQYSLYKENPNKLERDPTRPRFLVTEPGDGRQQCPDAHRCVSVGRFMALASRCQRGVLLVSLALALLLIGFDLMGLLVLFIR